MGCVSSKILSKSGSFQEKVVSHGFKGSNLIEEIILSTPKKSNCDQFLALLRTSNSSAAAASRGAKDTADQSTTEAAAEEFVKIETINVSELLAGLEEDEEEEDEEERDDDEKRLAQQCVLDVAAGRARSFRTVEEFDVLVTQSSSPEQGKEARAAVASSSDRDATSAKPSEQEEAAAAAGNKRRARARQLGELKVPPAFDFSKSGSLRDWLLQGGQIFSPGSYVTPKFGTSSAPPRRKNGEYSTTPATRSSTPCLTQSWSRSSSKPWSGCPRTRRASWRRSWKPWERRRRRRRKRRRGWRCQAIGR